jgi:sugar lactone lactonase YvrE
VDNAGNLYIGDSVNHRVREMAIGGNINTVVGTGTAGDTTGVATSSQIQDACGLLLDSSGNLYVADTTNNEVKKVSGGTLSTIAGTGTGGFSLDGNPAVKAELNKPQGLALNAGGVLYIADASNQRVRAIDTNGIINTVVNYLGTAGYLGDGNAAINAFLNNPLGLAMDAAGNLYIADTDNSVIRKVVPDSTGAISTGTISTVAGKGTNGYSGDGGLATQAQLNHPKDVAVDAAGNLYIADTNNCVIRVVTLDGIIHTVAGNGTPGYGGDGGTAGMAQLQFPNSVKVDSAGNVYIADSGNQVVRQLMPVATGPPSVIGVVSSSLFGGSSAVAPGSWIEVQGSNLAGESRSWLLADFSGVVAPTSLERTSVSIGGQFAPIASIRWGRARSHSWSRPGPGRPARLRSP